MGVVSLSVTATMATGSLQFPLVATIVGSLCGVILLSIVIVIMVISLLCREKIRGIIILLCNCVMKLEFSRAHNNYRYLPVHLAYTLYASMYTDMRAAAV